MRGKKCGDGIRNFCRRIGKGIVIYCILGFTVGMLMAMFFPPAVIAVAECIMLIFLCVCLYNSSLF